MKENTRKVLLACLLIIVALLSFTNATFANSPQGAVISNTPVQAKPGATIKTTLNLDASSGVGSFDFFLNYNPDNLTLLSAEMNDDCEGSLIIKYDIPGQISIAFSSTNNISHEMPFADLEFMVDDTIGIGIYDIIELNTSKTVSAFIMQGSQSVEIPFHTSFSPFSIYGFGDVDLDGRILSIDATFILRHTVGLSVLSDVQFFYADAYTDACVDTFDATWILRHTVGYDVQLGNRVNIIFHRMDGSIYATKSVAFGADLIKLPVVPYEEGFANGRWSMSSTNYVEPGLQNIERAVNVYPIYEVAESAAMKFYKERLTEQYYIDPTHILPTTNLLLTRQLTYQNGKHAVIYWSSDKSAIFNATNGIYSQPNYDQEVILSATIVAYDGESIEAQGVLPFPFTAKGKYQTPTKAEIATYLKSVIGNSIDYNMLLPLKVTNREVEKQNPYEVRVYWEIAESDGIEHPTVQMERSTTSRSVNLVATITFNGVPLEDDGKVYFDNVTLTAITESEIRHSIIQQIAANTGLTLTTGDTLWNDDQVYHTSVQWISKNVNVANIAANMVTIRPTAINGSSFPMEAQVTYLSDTGAKTFGIAYTTSIVNENTLLVPGVNIQAALYDALRDSLAINGNLTVEHLKTPTFVYLDLSKHPDITDLTGLTYCKNLRVLNISGLRIERALNEVSTLLNLEAFIARNCGIDNLSDGGIPVLKTSINLKLLDLSHNNFTSLNSVLADNVMYAKLQEIYLNNNQLTDISALNRAPILYFLAMSHNGLDSSDIENFASFKYLRYLSVSDNNITSITPLKDLTNLMELHLYNNQITNVRDLQMLVNMRALYLGGNQITDVAWLNNLRQLKILYLNDNKLIDISGLTALTKLEALNVSGNELQNLSMLSSSKDSMKELYAEDNEIRSFSFLSGMTGLQKLMLSGNANTVEPSLPNNLAALSNLKTLTISGKPLANGLGFLDNMTKLTHLDVSDCGLPDGSDVHLPATLQFLDISNNTNLVIDSGNTHGIYELDGLVGLYADNMQGNIIPDQLFALMSRLQYVSLENCGVESIAWMSRFVNLIYVDLAGNPIRKIDFNSMPTTLKKNLIYLLLDAETTSDFVDAYYAYNGIGDVPMEVLSLSGSQINSMIKLPFFDHIKHLDISHSGITNLDGENLELAELYSIVRYQTVETLDVSGLQSNISPVESLNDLHTLYAIGSSSDQIFYRENILSLYRLYNKGVSAYLYSKDEAYEPVALREGTEILSELPDISRTIRVAADNMLSDNNPLLAETVNDFLISWSVSNDVNYEIIDNKLSIKDYNNIVDEELILTAEIDVYPYQSSVSRSFAIQTDILRANAEYLDIDHSGIADYMTRNSYFVYDVKIKEAPTEGFSTDVKPVYMDVRYSYEGKLADGTNIPYVNILATDVSDISMASGNIFSSLCEIPDHVEPIESENLTVDSILSENDGPSDLEAIADETPADDAAVADSSSEEGDYSEDPYSIEGVVGSEDGSLSEVNSNSEDTSSEDSTYSEDEETIGEETAIWDELNSSMGSPDSVSGDIEKIEMFVSLFSEASNRFMITSYAPLGSQVTISVDVGHSESGNSFVVDVSVSRTIEVASRTFTINYYPNGGQVISISDGSTLTSEQYLEDMVLFERITWLRLGYIFEGWFIDEELTIPFAYETMPAEDVDLYAKWKAHSYTVTFNPNGGETGTMSKLVLCDTAYGELPEPSLIYYDFCGWFTDKEGGMEITAETIAASISTDQVLYAQWQRRVFNLIYDANGGSVSPTNKTVNCGDTYGDLPIPTRDYYNFLGWFTETTGGMQVSDLTVADNATTTRIVYARWELKSVSDWVLASETPAGSQTVSQKWQYSHTQTSISSTAPNGYYYVSSAYDGWSGWSNWQTASIANQYNPYHNNDNSHLIREVATRWIGESGHTEWHYYRWTNGTGCYSYKYNSSYWLEETWFSWQLPAYGNGFGDPVRVNGSGVKNMWFKANYEGNWTTDRTWTRWVVDVWAHTEYQSRTRTANYSYRKDNIEVNAYPSGSGITNIVEYVQYRPR